jgi:hypothetical protein
MRYPARPVRNGRLAAERNPRSTSRRSRLLALAGVIALMAALLPAGTVIPVLASHTPQPTSVTIAGSLQSELGCSDDWQPDCAASGLAFDAGDQVWQGTFGLPAKAFEYKAALNGTWDENYGANAAFNGANVAMSLPDPASVKLYRRCSSRSGGCRRCRGSG